MRLSILRDGSVIERTIVPETHEMRDVVGRRKTVGLIGIVPKGEIMFRKYGPVRAFVEGTKEVWTMTVLTWQALTGVVTGRLAIKESLAGPIGVFMMTGEAAHLGFIYVIHIMAVLSLSLGIFNILPIPVLDGGHVLFLMLEGLRGGRPISMRIRTAATQVGLALLLMLVAVTFYSDFSKFGIAGKVVSWWRHEETGDSSPQRGTP